MRVSKRAGIVVAAATVPLMAIGAFSAAPVAGAATAGVHGVTRQIVKAGTTRLSSSSKPDDGTGVASNEVPRFSGFDDGDAAGTVANRSHSAGSAPSAAPSAQSKPITNSTPGLQASFDGLNHFDNRFGNTDSPNTFSLEPPDQGLCVGSDGTNTRVLEVLNDVLDVYNTAGSPVLAKPVGLSGFLGYAPAINRTTGDLGPFVTDPSCLYDAQTGHWFIDVLTLDVYPQVGSDGLEHFTGTNHLDLAVSNSSDPAGTWTIYRIPVQDDGSDSTPDHGCSPSPDPIPDPAPSNPTACFGDYPHIGSDSNGIYLTTNEYSFFGNEFHGAQVYAFSKAQLASLPPTITMTQFDTHGQDTFGFGLNGFTLWPSQTPGGAGDPASGGTEYLLSSNAGAEAHDTGDGTADASPSTQLLVWALTNTSSLNGTAALTLSSTKLDVGRYAPPPAADQKSGNTPLATCLQNKQCSGALNGEPDPFPEKEYSLDSNDTRMQQVTWVNGKLWGALDTSLQMTGQPVAGVEWFDVAPSTATGSVTATLANQGYLGLGNDNLTYPAIGVTAGGTGLMAFTVVGSDYFPSAGYATLTNDGVGAPHVAAAGQGPADGFSGYKYYGDTPGVARPRWGDYGAAAADGNSIWIASEYVAQSCSFATYQKTNFRCGSTRTALANWGTRISEVAAP